MKSIFEDPGNRKALKMDKTDELFEVHIREPATIRTKDKDAITLFKSLLTQNKIKFEISKSIINN